MKIVEVILADGEIEEASPENRTRGMVSRHPFRGARRRRLY